MDSSVACIIPTYCEATSIKSHLNYHTRHFNFDEIAVVDGGSDDNTLERVRESNANCRLIQLTPSSRARQLNEGIRVTQSPWIVMLHADTWIPRRFSIHTLTNSSSSWGWFDCKFNNTFSIFSIISTAITLRSRTFSSPTGDQVIWVKRSLMNEIGGIPQQPLMEDVELVRRLKEWRNGTPISYDVLTSPRRWQNNGIISTILSMWLLKFSYFMGASPDTLAKLYYPEKYA